MHDIWRLRHFLGVAEAGSFHAAARRLHISQPAMTKSIRMLEEAFGTELFLRLPRGVNLTEAGEALKRHALDIDASWNAAIIEVGAQASGMGGFIRIGGGPVYSAVYFPNMLADLRRAFPKLTVSVSTDIGSELLPALNAGDIRLYAGGMPDNGSAPGAGLETRFLYHQENALYASSRHPIFETGGDAEAALAYPWLSLFSGQQANVRINSYFHRHGLAGPNLAIESHSLQIALKMITDHNFIACMPRPLAEAFPGINLRELSLPDFRWSIPTGVTFHKASLGFAPIALMVRSLTALTEALRATQSTASDN